GVGKKFRQLWRELRTAAIAAFISFQGLVDGSLYTAWVDTGLFQNQLEIGARVFNQARQHVFYGDFVVRPVQAQACGMLKGIAAGWVEPIDQGFEIDDLHVRYPVSARSSRMEALPAEHQFAAMNRAAVYSVSPGSSRLCETTDKQRWGLPTTRLVTAQGSGLRCVPGVLCLDAVRHEGIDNGLVSEGDRLHVTHGLIGRVQALRDELVHGGNDGVLDFDGVVQ